MVLSQRVTLLCPDAPGGILSVPAMIAAAKFARCPYCLTHYVDHEKSPRLEGRELDDL